jgi:hypothetical protein
MCICLITLVMWMGSFPIRSQARDWKLVIIWLLRVRVRGYQEEATRYTLSRLKFTLTRIANDHLTQPQTNKSLVVIITAFQ